MHFTRMSLLPSQPGPPVTSGCWSQFSTLPQAQSICWCFRQGDKVAKEKREVVEGGGRGGKKGWTEGKVDTKQVEGKVRKREGEDTI